VRVILCVLAVLAVSTVATASPVVAVYTGPGSLAAWTAAQGGATIVVEDFNDTTLLPGLSIVGSAVSIDGTSPNKMWDRIVSQTTTFNLPSAGFSFGGDWDLAGPGGQGFGLKMTLVNGGSYTIPTEIPASIGGGFWGVVSDTAFSKVEITKGTQNPPNAWAETYTLEDLRFQQAPEPASLLLCAFGAAFLATRRRRRKA